LLRRVSGQLHDDRQLQETVVQSGKIFLDITGRFVDAVYAYNTASTEDAAAMRELLQQTKNVWEEALMVTTTPHYTTTQHTLTL